MSLTAFIPVIWSGTFVRYLDKTLVFGRPGVCNRDYEGEISAYGDTVKIGQIGPITIRDYTKDTTITAPEVLTGDMTALVVDQAKYFNFAVDDLDKAQTNPKAMQTAMSRAAYGVADVIDQFLATTLGASIASDNVLSADTSMSSTDFYDHLVELAAVLDAANVPSEGRWCVITPKYVSGLAKDTRYMYAGLAAQVLQNRNFGQVAGLNLMVSNNVEVVTTNVYKIVAGVDAACTFAQQVVELEAYRPPDRFADAVKGLHVYGAKVVLPSALASINVTLS